MMIKSFGNFINENVKSELDSILYLLTDLGLEATVEGWDIISKRWSIVNLDSIIGVLLTTKSLSDSIDYRIKITKRLMGNRNPAIPIRMEDINYFKNLHETSEYQEFLDRLSEFCENKYIIKPSNNIYPLKGSVEVNIGDLSDIVGDYTIGLVRIIFLTKIKNPNL